LKVSAAVGPIDFVVSSRDAMLFVCNGTIQHSFQILRHSFGFFYSADQRWLRRRCLLLEITSAETWPSKKWPSPPRFNSLISTPLDSAHWI
jgi:hypothetical protein